jgi:glycosyltransferase involved in cell wall biosynthesis
MYHYLPPDDVISAVLFGDVCAGLAADGWQVTAFPCIWGCRDEKVKHAKTEIWQNVSMRRIWRPRFRQSSTAGRLLNALWMVAAWSLRALRPGPGPDVLIIGTDPPVSILTALCWNIFRPKTKIVHWCHDLFPEAAVCDGSLPAQGLLARLLRAGLRPAYAACSTIFDLGPCMRQLLAKYPSPARRETIVPWALNEPLEPLSASGPERTSIFGDTRLALMYSGSFGRAHTHDAILDLLEILEPDGIRMAFSIRGNRSNELKQAVAERHLDVRFPGFARPEDLALRSACADVHVVSLNREWTGTVVPSKFFGALAAGRPVLFYGSAESALAHWISEFRVGWVLNDHNINSIADQLLAYAAYPRQQKEMQDRCFFTYHSHFSRSIQIEKWNSSLRSLLADPPMGQIVVRSC